jgi:anti-sigma B factor antagonist
LNQIGYVGHNQWAAAAVGRLQSDLGRLTMYETAHPDPTPGTSRRGPRLDDTGFSYEVVHEEARVVVAMEGELDLAAAPALQRELLALVARPVNALSLDLGEVTFLDSSGLGALYRTRQAADEMGVPLRLVAVPDHVLRVLDVTAMAPLFDFEARSA